MAANACKLISVYCPDYGIDEYECGYNTTIACDECKFVVGPESGDRRRGLDPAAKCHQIKEQDGR